LNKYFIVISIGFFSFGTNAMEQPGSQSNEAEIVVEGRKCPICQTECNYQCSGCEAVNYCSSEHQNEDWKRHKPECERLKAILMEQPGSQSNEAEIVVEGRKCPICQTESNYKCSGCEAVNYCSSEHQNKDWKRHKPECERLKAIFPEISQKNKVVDITSEAYFASRSYIRGLYPLERRAYLAAVLKSERKLSESKDPKVTGAHLLCKYQVSLMKQKDPANAYVQSWLARAVYLEQRDEMTRERLQTKLKMELLPGNWAFQVFERVGMDPRALCEMLYSVSDQFLTTMEILRISEIFDKDCAIEINTLKYFIQKHGPQIGSLGHMVSRFAASQSHFDRVFRDAQDLYNEYIRLRQSGSFDFCDLIRWMNDPLYESAADVLEPPIVKQDSGDIVRQELPIPKQSSPILRVSTDEERTISYDAEEQDNETRCERFACDDDQSPVYPETDRPLFGCMVQ
jgi:hypothetical protein